MKTPMQQQMVDHTLIQQARSVASEVLETLDKHEDCNKHEALAEYLFPVIKQMQLLQEGFYKAKDNLIYSHTTSEQWDNQNWYDHNLVSEEIKEICKIEEDINKIFWERNKR